MAWDHNTGETRNPNPFPGPDFEMINYFLPRGALQS